MKLSMSKEKKIKIIAVAAIILVVYGILDLVVF